MRPIATGDAKQSGMCVGHTGELCKTAEPIEMLFATGNRYTVTAVKF